MLFDTSTPKPKELEISGSTNLSFCCWASKPDLWVRAAVLDQKESCWLLLPAIKSLKFDLDPWPFCCEMAEVGKGWVVWPRRVQFLPAYNYNSSDSTLHLPTTWDHKIMTLIFHNNVVWDSPQQENDDTPAHSEINCYFSIETIAVKLCRMRGALLLLPLLGCASALPQGGFLSGIGNAFNNFFGGFVFNFKW